MADVITERITRTPGVCGGRACIAGHRIRVIDIVTWHEYMGMSADEIANQYPTITISDVYAALAYYFEHDEIQEEMRREDEFVEEFLRNNPSVIDMRLQKLVDEADD